MARVEPILARYCQTSQGCLSYCLHFLCNLKRPVEKHGRWISLNSQPRAHLQVSRILVHSDLQAGNVRFTVSLLYFCRPIPEGRQSPSVKPVISQSPSLALSLSRAPPQFFLFLSLSSNPLLLVLQVLLCPPLVGDFTKQPKVFPKLSSSPILSMAQ